MMLPFDRLCRDLQWSHNRRCRRRRCEHNRRCHEKRKRSDDATDATDAMEEEEENDNDFSLQEETTVAEQEQHPPPMTERKHVRRCDLPRTFHDVHAARLGQALMGNTEVESIHVCTTHLTQRPTQLIQFLIHSPSLQKVTVRGPMRGYVMEELAQALALRHSMVTLQLIYEEATTTPSSNRSNTTPLSTYSSYFSATSSLTWMMIMAGGCYSYHTEQQQHHFLDSMRSSSGIFGSLSELLFSSSSSSSSSDHNNNNANRSSSSASADSAGDNSDTNTSTVTSTTRARKKEEQKKKPVIQRLILQGFPSRLLSLILQRLAFQQKTKRHQHGLRYLRLVDTDLSTCHTALAALLVSPSSSSSSPSSSSSTSQKVPPTPPPSPVTTPGSDNDDDDDNDNNDADNHHDNADAVCCLEHLHIDRALNINQNSSGTNAVGWEETLQAIQHSTTLRQLTLSRCILPGRVARHLSAALQHTTSLQAVTVDDCVLCQGKSWMMHAMQGMQSNRSIRSLQLDFLQESPAHFHRQRRHRHHRNRHQNHNGGGHQQHPRHRRQHRQQQPRHPAATAGSANAWAQGLQRLLEENTFLQRLQVAHQFLGNAGVQQVADGLQHQQQLLQRPRNATSTTAAVMGPGLQHLELRHCGMQTMGFSALCQVVQQQGMGLQSLVVTDNFLGGGGGGGGGDTDDILPSLLQNLIQSTRHTELRHLGLSGCELTDEALLAMVQALTTTTNAEPETRLEGLALSGNVFSDFSWQTLAKSLPQIHSLQQLRMSMMDDNNGNNNNLVNNNNNLDNNGNNDNTIQSGVSPPMIEVFPALFRGLDGNRSLTQFVLEEINPQDDENNHADDDDDDEEEEDFDEDDDDINHHGDNHNEGQQQGLLSHIHRCLLYYGLRNRCGNSLLWNNRLGRRRRRRHGRNTTTIPRQDHMDEKYDPRGGPSLWAVALGNLLHQHPRTVGISAALFLLLSLPEMVMG